MDLRICITMIFLSCFTLSVARFDLNRYPDEAFLELGGPSQELSRQEEPIRKRRKLNYWQTPSGGASDQHLTEPIDDQALKLSIQKIKTIKENWTKNQDQLSPLRQETMELSSIMLNMYDELWTLRSRAPATKGLGKLSDAILHLHKFEATLLDFIQLKIYQIGEANLQNLESYSLGLLGPKKRGRKSTKDPKKIESLPNDILETLITKTRQVIADQTLQKFKQLIICKRKFPVISSQRAWDAMTPPSQDISLMCWKYAFKVVELLFNQKFLEQESFRRFFRDPDVIRSLIGYTKLRFKREINSEPEFDEPYLLTEHWYWPSLQKSFTALGEKEKDLINAHFLLEVRHQDLAKLVRQGRFRKKNYDRLRTFFNDFDAQWYLSKVRGLDKAQIMKDTIGNGRKRRISIDIGRLMDIIGSARNSYWNPSYLQRHLHDILDLIDNKISPNIIKLICSFTGKNHPSIHPTVRFFFEKFNIFKLEAKIHDLDRRISQHYSFIQRESPNDWSTSISNKLILENYLSQVVALKKEFYDNEYDRSSQSGKFHSAMAEMEQLHYDLKLKCNSFSQE